MVADKMVRKKWYGQRE